MVALAAYGQGSAPLVLAHRGGKMLRPENTLAAFQHAVELGVDIVELDLAVTKDDRVVVHHDRSVNLEDCVVPGEERPERRPIIRLLSFAETQRFDCGSRNPNRFPNWKASPGARMPEFGEVLELLRGTKVRILGETKMAPDGEPGFVEPAHFAKLVYEIVRRHGMKARVILQSGDYRTLTEVRKLDPGFRVCQLVAWRQPGDWVRTSIEFGATHELVTNSALTVADVRRLKAAGVTVFSSTANDAATWKKVVDLEVDGILTDDPAGLIEYLKIGN